MRMSLEEMRALKTTEYKQPAPTIQPGPWMTAPSQPALQQAVSETADKLGVASPYTSLKDGSATLAQPKKVTDAVAQDKPLDMDNEKRYLEGLVAQGGGNAIWAQQQAAKYGITLDSPAMPSTVSGSMSAAPPSGPAPGSALPGATPGQAPGQETGPAAEPERAGQAADVKIDPLDPNSIVRAQQAFFSGFDEVVRSVNAETSAVFQASMNEFYRSFDAMQAQVMGMFEEQMQGIDPATKAALDELGERAKEHRRLMLEDLSRRGILQSGVAIEADIRLNKDKMTAEQRMLAERISAIQGQMMSAMMQFAQSRLSAMQQFGMQATDLAARAGDQRLGAFRDAMGQATQLAGMQEQSRQFGLGYDQKDRQFGETMAFSREQAEAQAKQDAARMGLEWAKLSEVKRSNLVSEAMAKSQQEFNQNQTQGNYATQQALYELRSYQTKEEALAALAQGDRWQRMATLGVDMNALLAAIEKLPAGKTTGTATKTDQYTRDALGGY